MCAVQGTPARLLIACSLFAGVCVAQTSGVWEERAPLPIGLTEVSAAAIGERVYVTCGIAASGLRSNLLHIYDSAADAWTLGAPLPIDRGADHCNLVATEGSLYFVGGLRIGQGFLTNRTLRYDPAANAWTELSPMPTPRGASGVAAIGRKIYVIGGEGAQTAGVAAEVYDIATDRWSALPPLPGGGRTHLTAQAVGGRLYAVGGRRGGLDTVEAGVFELIPEAGTWASKAPMPTPRGGAASGILGGRIVVLGGEGPSGRPERTYEQVEEYDPSTDRWRSLGAMPSPRHGMQGATATSGADGARIQLIGGGPSAGLSFSQTHDVLFAQPERPPSITAASIVNAASGQARLSAGSAASVFAAHLPAAAQAAKALPLPTRLSGVEILLNGQPAPLYFVGPGQGNFQVPFGMSGAVEIRIGMRGAVSAPALVEIAEAAPGVFSLEQSGEGQGAVLIAGTGQVAGPLRPARRGEVLEIYGTGVGSVGETLPPGVPAPTDRLLSTLALPRVRLGGVLQQALFCGLAPGLVGVWQTDIVVAEATPSGPRVVLELEAGGVRANQVTVAVE